MTNPTPGGFGQWIKNNSRALNNTPLSPRHGSFVASILQELGYLDSSLEGNAVILKFKTYTMNTISPNSFDRGKPFYPLIMNFLIQLIGFKELAIRGITGRRSIDDDISQFLEQLGVSGQDFNLLRSSMESVMGPLELRSEFSNSSIEIDIDEIANEVAHHNEYLAELLPNALGVIFILAHEMTKEKPWHNKNEIWEFLRHCRNAAAHGGKFHFLNDEPRRCAKWGPFEITRSLQGTPFLISRMFLGCCRQAIL